MARNGTVRKKATALWPYHHWIIAPWTPGQSTTDFDDQIDTGTARLLMTCSIAMVTMKER